MYERYCKLRDSVAPLVGAWIEMQDRTIHPKLIIVAPLVGAWIEIFEACEKSKRHGSLLSWERGLKSAVIGIIAAATGRSSRGSVD